MRATPRNQRLPHPSLSLLNDVTLQTGDVLHSKKFNSALLKLWWLATGFVSWRCKGHSSSLRGTCTKYESEVKQTNWQPLCKKVATPKGLGGLCLVIFNTCASIYLHLFAIYCK